PPKSTVPLEIKPPTATLSAPSVAIEAGPMEAKLSAAAIGMTFDHTTTALVPPLDDELLEDELELEDELDEELAPADPSAPPVPPPWLGVHAGHETKHSVSVVWTTVVDRMGNTHPGLQRYGAEFSSCHSRRFRIPRAAIR